MNDDLIQTVRSIVNLPDPVVLAFGELFQSIHLAKGQDWVREGEMATQIAFLSSGLMRSYYISPSGEVHNKHFFLERSFLAPMTSLVLKQPSPVFLGALEDSCLEVASYAEVLRAFDRFPELNRLGRVLMEYAWIGKERRETQLIMLDSAARYRAFLQEYPGLEMRVPLYHIASYLGISAVQLSRLRSRKLT
ncbi:MAG: Crp/Fnr family transcriptional regulator [Acidobacteria bacterium]|nr:Crp/Fnr family transcriptional regulator [Acidobacteriota bacterium]